MLVVDDDERVLASFVRTLRGHRQVFTASTPVVATELARREQPDLIIIDLRLGPYCGLDVVRAMKAEMPGAVLALVSGYLSIDTTVAAVRAGADVVLTKPITGGEVVRRAEDGTAEDADAGQTPTLAEAEAEHIARVLTDCSGNISETARRLGIHRSSLQRKLRKAVRRG